MTTTRYAFTLLVQNQASAEIVFNGDINLLDSMVGLNLLSMALATPPGSPATGDTYVVAASGTGAWLGQDGNIAVYIGGWIFITPKAGMQAYDSNTTAWVRYNGTVWSGGKYTVANLPTGVEGMTAYATNGRKVGQGVGAGTGVPVYFSASSWRVHSTDAAVAS